MLPLVEIDELQRIYNNEDVLLFDVRNGKNAREDYEKEHLWNAIFIDLNSQLAHVPHDYSLGGRHPLPKLNEFAQMLSSFGITKNNRLIIYDDKNGSNAAARFWWMLKSVGHEKVQVLNGGLQQAKKHNFPMGGIKVQKEVITEEYLAESWGLLCVDLSQVEKAMQDPDYLIIDVRDKLRYEGEHEPIDLIAGHIPGAINVPFTENLDESGLFLKPEFLRKKYESILGNHPPEKTIIHCGSGVTACHTLLALDYARIPLPNLYVGSWSEWSRCNKPIEGKKS